MEKWVFKIIEIERNIKVRLRSGLNLKFHEMRDFRPSLFIKTSDVTSVKCSEIYKKENCKES